MPGSFRLLLATGLAVSAGLVIVAGAGSGGGGWAIGIGGGQAALAGALLLRPRSTGPLAGAVLFLIPAPLAAVRHWSARLPGACQCARLPQPAPGLVSLTGLVVVIDLALLGLTLRLAATRRRLAAIPPAEVEKSPA